MFFSQGNINTTFDPTHQSLHEAQAGNIVPLSHWRANENTANVAATKSTQPLHNGLTGGITAHTVVNRHITRPIE